MLRLNSKPEVLQGVCQPVCLCMCGQLQQRICTTFAAKLASFQSGKSAVIAAFPSNFIITALQAYPTSCRGLVQPV